MIKVNRPFLAAFFGIVGILGAEVRAEDENGFVPIFNAVDLKDWDGMPDAWEVREGAIWSTGKSSARNWLIWRGSEPEDFILRLKFRYLSGNSGVQVRSEDLGDWQVRGYQVEVAEQDAMGLWHHSLMSRDLKEENSRKTLATAGQRVTIWKNGTKRIQQFSLDKRVQAAYRQDDWNDLEIIVRGPRLIQKINGVIFSDLTDHQEDYSRRHGVIALQDHGKGCVVGFRNLELKLLQPVEPSMEDSG